MEHVFSLTVSPLFLWLNIYSLFFRNETLHNGIILVLYSILSWKRKMFGVRYIRIHWGDSGRYRPIWTDIARFGPILGTVYHFAECIACIVYGFRFTFITRFLLVLDQTELQGLWIEGFYWCSVRRNLELGFLEYFFREEILYEWFSISIRFAKTEKIKIRYLFQRQKCLLGCKENWHKK